MAAKVHFQSAVNLVSVVDPSLSEQVLKTFGHLSRAELAPEPLVGGKDLIKAGFKAGPAFTQVIDGVYDAQLEGRVTSMEDAMDLARTLWQSLQSK